MVKDSVTAAVHKAVKIKVVPFRLIWYFLLFCFLIRLFEVCLSCCACVVVTCWCTGMYHSTMILVQNHYYSLAFYVLKPKNIHRLRISRENDRISTWKFSSWNGLNISEDSSGSRCCWTVNSWRLEKTSLFVLFLLFLFICSVLTHTCAWVTASG